MKNIKINCINANIKYKLLVDIISFAILSSSSISFFDEDIEGITLYYKLFFCCSKYFTSDFVKLFSIPLLS